MLQLSNEIIYALDFSFWKKPLVRNFLGKKNIIFVKDLNKVPKKSVVAVWGISSINNYIKKDFQLLHLEDGFLRSVGLGADLIKPISWVVDKRGIYYNSQEPSDIEHILQTTLFNEELLQRASSLREKIIGLGLTKYNTGIDMWKKPSTNKKIILVVGQVESDASIKYGSPVISTNIALLQKVRQENQNAYIIYKPHPDVVAGLRAKGFQEEDASKWCDEIVLDVFMHHLLLNVDEVHVMTSLAGFEALLRGKKVVCYGQPFYSGWGLTYDMLPHERRTRILTIDELVAGSLILYPRYISLKNGTLISPEDALDELAQLQRRKKNGVSLYRKFSRMIIRKIVGVR